MWLGLMRGWDRFRFEGRSRQIFIWAVVWPLPLAMFASTRQRRRTWVVLAVVAAVVWAVVLSMIVSGLVDLGTTEEAAVT